MGWGTNELIILSSSFVERRRRFSLLLYRRRDGRRGRDGVAHGVQLPLRVQEVGAEAVADVVEQTEHLSKQQCNVKNDVLSRELCILFIPFLWFSRAEKGPGGGGCVRIVRIRGG